MPIHPEKVTGTHGQGSYELTFILQQKEKIDMMHTRKLTVGSVIGTIVLGSLILALLIFTASRTVHFLQMTFPPDFQYIAYLALAAFDGGILGWTIFATVASEGAVQRGLAYLMIFVCLVGVILTTVADTIISSGKNGLTSVPPYMATVGIWGSLAVIILNVVAGVVAHLASPHHVRKFQLESIHDGIWQLSMQHVRESALTIGPEVARAHADHWVRTTIQDSIGSLPVSQQQQMLPPAVESTLVSASSRNQMIDPYQVKPQVDAEKKSIEKKPSLFARMRSAIDERIDGKSEPVEEEQDDEVEKTIEEEEVYEVIDPAKKSPASWTNQEWMMLRDQIDAFAFATIWKMYKGDAPQPGEKIIEKKKGRGGKKAKNLASQDV